MPERASYSTAILRFSDAPDLHEALTRQFGPPDVCFVAGEPRNATGEKYEDSMWMQESSQSSVSASAGVEKYLAWAAEIVRKHHDPIANFMRAGAKVSLYLDSRTDYPLFTLEPALLAPFVELQIPIEIYAESSRD